MHWGFRVVASVKLPNENVVVATEFYHDSNARFESSYYTYVPSAPQISASKRPLSEIARNP